VRTDYLRMPQVISGNSDTKLKGMKISLHETLVGKFEVTAICRLHKKVFILTTCEIAINYFC
jgi:hypothetical protein